ncbi:MAG: integrase family protein, partial [Microvirga sp.]|nr:integrase family protein [Microvirga sp.]
LRRLAQAHRPALAHHGHRPAPLGAWVLISESWYQWLSACGASGLERSTTLHYGQHVAEHINPFIGGLKLTQVTTPRVYAFIDELTANGRSPEMVRRAVQSLGRVFKFAKGRGLAAHNPVAGVELRSSKRGKARAEVPSKDELRAILATAQGRWRPLIVTALFTGLRASELRGLRWSDLTRKVLHVRQRADAWKALGTPKTAAGQRDVPLAPVVINTLREWRLACPRGDLDLVFPTGAGNVEDHPNIVARGWNPVQVAAGVVSVDGRSKYNFHVLRHAAASMFIEQGMNPKRIQSVMGHSSIQVTYDVYGFLFADDDADQKAMEAIEARLLG